MLFFKYYDQKNNFLTYCGLGHFLRTMLFSELLPVMCEKAGLPKSTPLLVFEEEYLNVLNKINNFNQPLSVAINELMDGDIIVFQRDNIDLSYDGKSLTVNEYFADLLNRVEVLFCDKNNPNDPGFVLELSQKMNYTQIANAVALRLGTDPYLIQFFKNQRYLYNFRAH